eukprot:EG_transcript_15184
MTESTSTTWRRAEVGVVGSPSQLSSEEALARFSAAQSKVTELTRELDSLTTKLFETDAAGYVPRGPDISDSPQATPTLRDPPSSLPSLMDDLLRSTRSAEMQLYETRVSESALQTEIQFLRQASETREKKLQDDIRRLQAELASHMRRSENGGLAGESPQYAADLQHLADAASAPHYDQERWLSRYQMLESRAREAELQVVSLRIERDTVRQQLLEMEALCKKEHERTLVLDSQLAVKQAECDALAARLQAAGAGAAGPGPDAAGDPAVQRLQRDIQERDAQLTILTRENQRTLQEMDAIRRELLLMAPAAAPVHSEAGAGWEGLEAAEMTTLIRRAKGTMEATVRRFEMALRTDCGAESAEAGLLARVTALEAELAA